MKKPMSFQRMLESILNRFRVTMPAGRREPGMTLLFIFLITISVNFIAALGPELGFDALWYHLTIPKIYLMWGKIDFIPGGLLYYSAMPRLAEFLFAGNWLWAHLISWLAGVGAAFFTYKIARKIGLSSFYSLLSALIFYATPLVGWISGSAYIDLIRTFFEVTAVYFVISKKYLMGGLIMGLAISTKTLAFGSAAILFAVSGFKFSFLIPAIMVSAPWFIWACQKTGYPFYPIGAGILNTNEHSSFFNLFTEDKLNPIFMLGFLNRKNFALLLYCIIAFIYWILTPQNGGGRFLLPYLPVFAVLAADFIKDKKLFVFFAIIFAAGSIFYRGVANLKVVPYLLGRQTQNEYLCKHLDFSTSVFVDCDGWFANNIKPTDFVLVKNYHNLYYINFPFVHESWYKNEPVNYILSGKPLDGNLIYKNEITHAYLYKL